MITTVIPSHGDRLTLRSAIEGALAAKSDEILVLDTVGDLPAWSRSLVGVKVVRAPDRGMSDNWNQAFGLGTGEWLHILHDDDTILPGFYDRLRSVSSRVVAFAVGYRNVEESTGRLTFRQQYSAILGAVCSPVQVGANHMLGWLTRGNPFRPSAVVMRREVARQYPFLNVGANDWLMWLRLASLGDWFLDPSILAEMRDGPENDGHKIGAVARAQAVLATIETAESWLPAPHHMLMARDQYAKIAAMEGATEIADRLALRRHKEAR